MSPNMWKTAARRRLLQDVTPRPIVCPFCNQNVICDVKGSHALTCEGGGHRILRHDRVRDLIATFAREAGFKTSIEHSGGLSSRHRPGDVSIENWTDGKTALVDVFIVNPTCQTHQEHIRNGQAGDAAYQHGLKHKHGKKQYKNIDSSKYTLIAFGLETAGGVTSEAETFVEALEERWRAKNSRDDPTNQSPLLTRISFELQRLNATMIIDRAPGHPTPTNDNFNAAVASVLAESKKAQLDIMELKQEAQRREPIAAQGWEPPTQVPKPKPPHHCPIPELANSNLKASREGVYAAPNGQTPKPAPSQPYSPPGKTPAIPRTTAQCPTQAKAQIRSPQITHQTNMPPPTTYEEDLPASSAPGQAIPTRPTSRPDAEMEPSDLNTLTNIKLRRTTLKDAHPCYTFPATPPEAPKRANLTEWRPEDQPLFNLQPSQRPPTQLQAPPNPTKVPSTDATPQPYRHLRSHPQTTPISVEVPRANPAVSAVTKTHPEPPNAKADAPPSATFQPHRHLQTHSQATPTPVEVPSANPAARVATKTHPNPSNTDAVVSQKTIHGFQQPTTPPYQPTHPQAAPTSVEVPSANPAVSAATKTYSSPSNSNKDPRSQTLPALPTNPTICKTKPPQRRYAPPLPRNQTTTPTQARQTNQRLPTKEPPNNEPMWPNRAHKLQTNPQQAPSETRTRETETITNPKIHTTAARHCGGHEAEGGSPTQPE